MVLFSKAPNSNGSPVSNESPRCLTELVLAKPSTSRSHESKPCRRLSDDTKSKSVKTHQNNDFQSEEAKSAIVLLFSSATTTARDLALPIFRTISAAQHASPDNRIDVFGLLCVPNVVCRYESCHEHSNSSGRDCEASFAHCDNGISSE